ncbi:MAG TPA: DUF305 domain-containing protein [Propionibacteriaceae bacterium]|nr:DUF305 domain-containing protein [Propionibacteriaceae bacterium]
MTTMRRLVGPALVLGLSLTLAACASVGGHDVGTEAAPAATSSAAVPSASATPSSGPRNEADVMFATMMIPHHAQAIEMAKLVQSDPGVDPKVAALAQRIQDAQSPEIAQMKGWLASWGEDSDGSSMSHEGHGAGGGMMSEEDLDALEAADGAEATKLFLEGMIEHHQGAVEMAKTQIAKGANPDAKRRAQAIVDAQNAEIVQMHGLLASS